MRLWHRQPAHARPVAADARARLTPWGVYVTTGADDFIVHVAVADNISLYAFVIDKLTERPEVADVGRSIAFEYFRNTRVAPIA